MADLQDQPTIIPRNSCNQIGDCCLPILAKLLDIASQVSLASDLADRSSLQYRAIEWLVEEQEENGDAVASYDDLEWLQRYIFLVYDFSTRPPDFGTGLVRGAPICDHPTPLPFFCKTDEQNQPVISRINGRNFGLVGTIPRELGYLSRLTSLDWYVNQYLTGTIPTELGLLTDLYILHLDSTSLSGPLPSELGNLTSLRYLTMIDAGLTGSIPSEILQLRNSFVQFRLTGNDLTVDDEAFATFCAENNNAVGPNCSV